MLQIIIRMYARHGLRKYLLQVEGLSAIRPEPARLAVVVNFGAVLQG
jgi:hypothetical protein